MMKFDIAFDESSRNADVYEHSVKPLVTSLFDKWANYCIAVALIMRYCIICQLYMC